MAFLLFHRNINVMKHLVKSLQGVSNNISGNVLQLLQPVKFQQCPQRTSTFFMKIPAEQLWKSVVSVSNAGKRRGRGRGSSKKFTKNLNYGQRIGVGKIQMIWPGLNSPILQGSHLVYQKQIFDDRLNEQKSQPSISKPMPTRSRIKVHPLERGWTSNTMCGRSVGPPDPVKDRKKDF